METNADKSEQMPLVDGALATKMIRFWEKESSKHRPPPGARDRDHSPKARVPIIAVSASLGDDGKFECIQNGYVLFSVSVPPGRLYSWKQHC